MTVFGPDVTFVVVMASKSSYLEILMSSTRVGPSSRGGVNKWWLRVNKFKILVPLKTSKLFKNTEIGIPCDLRFKLTKDQNDFVLWNDEIWS